MFEHGNLWYEKDPITFGNMKDYVLFAVPKLLAFCETRSINPMSETENHLNTVSIYSVDKGLKSSQMFVDKERDMDFTGFSLKSESCLVKIHLTCSYSLLALLLLSK